ncbi:hypothetical protein [Janthinobacterium psychrotolerans]|uniref:hypothetical protein n=1 Tax=Janthinobacterium psychrotolerans TaxID=1747903 RepID=UPI0014961BC8|nr:hypothetical protein [Janthinobacterium psychrotolerans]
MHFPALSVRAASTLGQCARFVKGQGGDRPLFFAALMHRKNIFPYGQNIPGLARGRDCKSLIIFRKKIACEFSKLLKPASMLALRLVKRGLSTTLSTVAVDIWKSRAKTGA